MAEKFEKAKIICIGGPHNGKYMPLESNEYELRQYSTGNGEYLTCMVERKLTKDIAIEMVRAHLNGSVVH